MEETTRLKKKICMLGDPAVGKTSLIRRFVYDTFDDRYISTIGTKVTKKPMMLEHPSQNKTIELTLMIWDIMGQQELSELQAMYFQGAEGALVVCDITRKSTLMHLRSWVSALYRVTGTVPVIFIANKIDLRGSAAVNTSEMEEHLSGYGYPYYFTSAKSGENVEKVFRALGMYIIDPSYEP